MVEKVISFPDKYTKYLKEYIFNGGDEHILLNAFEDLVEISDPYFTEAINIFEVHVKALEEILNIKRDNHTVQWIYIQRANEFLAQMFMTIDSVLLELREQIEKDALTGIGNRLAMTRVLPSLWFEAQKLNKPLTLAVLDLDNFKYINDTYSHIVGDKVLKEVAYVLISSIRKEDVAFRFGGEEFIIVFPRTNYDQAIVPLEKIRKNVESLDIGENNIKTTVSIGAASLFDDNPKNIDELIHYADLAMYKAKTNGKNKVVFFRDIKDIILDESKGKKN